MLEFEVRGTLFNGAPRLKIAATKITQHGTAEHPTITLQFGTQSITSGKSTEELSPRTKKALGFEVEEISLVSTKKRFQLEKLDTCQQEAEVQHKKRCLTQSSSSTQEQQQQPLQLRHQQQNTQEENNDIDEVNIHYAE